MKNSTFEDAKTLYVTVPVGTLSGDPVVYGQRPGVALINRKTDGKATVKFYGVANFNCEAVGAAIAEGDILYYHAGSTPKINNTSAGGVRYGYANGTLAVGTGALLVIIGY